MGPLHSPAQKTFVDEIIQEAKDSGANVREFGELPGGDMAGGNFLRPAIVVNPDPSLRVVTQEQFGPVIPIIPFDTEDEAVAAANDTWGGLCGSVWTADPRRGEPRRRPARLRLRLGQRPRRHPPRPACAVRRHEAVGYRSRAGHRGHPRLPGHPLDRSSRCGHVGDHASLITIDYVGG